MTDINQADQGPYNDRSTHTEPALREKYMFYSSFNISFQ